MSSATAVRWAAWEAAGRRSVTAGPLGAITFPLAPLAGRIEIALGADPAADPATWSWLDITQWIRYADGISISRGRPDEASTVDAAQAHLVLDNRDGRFARRNPLGPYYGLLSKNTPIRIGVDPGSGVSYRFHGFITEWPTRWTDESGNDCTAPVVCAGILRRLAHNTGLGSALTRAMAGISAGDFVPVAHWPMEDGAGATQLGAAVPGTLPASVSAGEVSLASYSGASGSKPVPTLSTDGQIAGVFPTIDLTPDSAGRSAWQVQFQGMIPSSISADAVFLVLNVNDTGGDHVVKLQLEWLQASTTLECRAYDRSGSRIGSTGLTITPTLRDQPLLIGFTLFQSVLGGPVSFSLVSFMSDGSGPAVSATPGPGLTVVLPAPQSWRAMASAGNTDWSFSHFALYTGAELLDFPNQTDNAAAIAGYTGELAADRMIRLCRESGVAFYCTSAVSAAMGPQIIGSLLDNLRDCEAADMGVLYEHEFGLGYQSLDDRINAPVQLRLDFDQYHIAGTPEPADDDQRTVNLAVASRPSGSSALAQDDGSIAVDGLYETSASVNVATDVQLPDVAQRRVFVGTVDEDRWPAIPIRLTGSPDLIPGWTGLPYGARMTVANPPSQVTPDTIDAVIEGWAEMISPDNWEAVLNTSPATQYKVGRMAAESGDTADDVGNLESDSCALAADVADAATSWSVNTTPLATTAVDDMGFLMRFGGEVVRVDSISGVANPQTWAVTRSVNGVSKAQTANTAGTLVRPFMPTT